MAPLAGDPFADVPRALEQLDAFDFLRGEEAHYISIHQCRFAEVEHEARGVLSDLRLNRVQVISLDPPTESERHRFAVECALDFERHA